MTAETTPQTIQQQTQTIQQRLAAAERSVADAHERAEYHGWSGATANAYAAALRDLHAARREAQRVMAEAEAEAESDGNFHEGFGAFGWAILWTLLVIGAVVGEFSAHVLR